MNRARVFRVLAIFFLAYTGLDLTVPQLCREEFNYQGAIQVAAASDLSYQTAAFSAVDATKKSSDDPAPRQHPQDEDCFCCCTHVLPSHVTAPVAMAELSPDVAALQKIVVASPILQAPYHPPR